MVRGKYVAFKCRQTILSAIMWNYVKMCFEFHMGQI